MAIFVYAKILGPPPLAVPKSTLYFADDQKTIIGESDNGEKRYWIPLDKISPYLIDATISTEDKRYYDHHGFDFKRIGGAIIADIKAMGKVEGASTITQQYARNLFLEHEKSWKRKLLEAFYAIRLEMNYSKKEILEGYLNTIYYGDGAYGIQAASQYYFNKDANNLTLAEASMLAGIPKGPSIYSPIKSMENAKVRQRIILQLMVDNQMISQVEATEAEHQPLKLIGKHVHLQNTIAPYFQDAVREALKSQLNLDERTIALGGLKVYTTLDVEAQKIIEDSIKKQISTESDIQVGVLAMDPNNGFVKAMVGGRDYEKSPYNRTIQAIRHPGSTIKPILYYAALEQGFSPVTTMRSELTTFRFEDGRPTYTPRNFNHQYADRDITLMQALAVSDNVFAVKTHLFLGEGALVNAARRFGITTPMEQVPSLALGTSGVRVMEIANAYSMLANGGKKSLPVLIKRVENFEGKPIYEYEPEIKKELDPKQAFVLTHMMTGVFDSSLNGYANVTGSTLINKMTRPYAAKSGTTETDSWMIGFSPQLVTAVWTGYDIGKPIELTVEKSYAKNIWIDVMEKTLADQPIKDFKPPKGVVGIDIDPQNGEIATKDCPIKRLTYFKEGTEPSEYCTDHLPKNKKKPKEKKLKKRVPWYERIF